MKNKIRTLLVNFLTNTIGVTLVHIYPKKANQLSTTGMTLVLEKDLDFFERLMRRAILKRLEGNGKFETLSNLHKNFWINKGDAFFSANQEHLNKILIPECEFAFDLLESEVKKENKSVTTLVEIGTGDGTVLNYVSGKIPFLKTLVGIDLNNKQTLLSQEKYKGNPKLKFYAEDGLTWIKENGEPNTIFLTFMGVLEYFTEKRLFEFFKTISKLDNSICLFIEPIDESHDFVINPNSKIFGSESSFSHNYSKLLEKAGFQLWHHSKKIIKGDTNPIVFVGAKN